MIAVSSCTVDRLLGFVGRAANAAIANQSDQIYSVWFKTLAFQDDFRYSNPILLYVYCYGYLFLGSSSVACLVIYVFGKSNYK